MQSVMPLGTTSIPPWLRATYAIVGACLSLNVRTAFLYTSGASGFNFHILP